MPRLGMRFSLGSVMSMIALFALILARVPAPLAILLSVVLSGMAVLVVAVAAVCNVSKVRAVTWAFGAYLWLPLGSLYLTWLVAWWTLGHPPRSLIDDPAFISDPVSLLRDLTWMLLLGGVPASVACLLLVMYECVLAVERDEAGRPNEVTRLVLIPPILWLGAIVVFAIDPGRVLDWLMD
jgi:hypothetical protein